MVHSDSLNFLNKLVTEKKGGFGWGPWECRLPSSFRPVRERRGLLYRVYDLAIRWQAI